MKISYYDLMLIVSMMSMDLEFETIDELINYLQENEKMSIHINKK